MTAKEYLCQFHILNLKIESYRRELNHLRYISSSLPGSKFDAMPGTHSNQSRIEICVCKIIDLERQIEEEINKSITLQKEIHNLIEEMEDTQEKMILRLRYIESLKWEKIAEELNYSSVQVYRIHKKALKSFEEKMKR